jgi:hypothetical protein
MPSKISLVLLSSATTIMTVNGPVGPMTTTAYVPFTLITTDPNPVVLGSETHNNNS